MRDKIAYFAFLKLRPASESEAMARHCFTPFPPTNSIRARNFAERCTNVKLSACGIPLSLELWEMIHSFDCDLAITNVEHFEPREEVIHWILVSACSIEPETFSGCCSRVYSSASSSFCRTPSAFEALCCQVLVATCRRGHYFFLCKLWVPFRLQGAREGSSTCAAEREGA